MSARSEELLRLWIALSTPDTFSLSRPCYCNTVVRHQGEPADQEPGWHCKEGRLCPGFRVPHHSAGSCAKVSVTSLVWQVASMSGCKCDANLESSLSLFLQAGICWLAENIWNTGWDGGASILTVSDGVMSDKNLFCQRNTDNKRMHF